MRLLFSAIVAAVFVVFAAATFAQSTSAPAAVPLAIGKRMACQTTSQGMKGQEQRDQMQLCMAQARLDCLKQAIDQKIVGPQRKEFVESCMQ
jgi:parvulin-like peptidyl-prolyl isomerase